MVARLTLAEREQLIHEERRRRVIARKQQVREQANEYSKQIRLVLKSKSKIIAESIRREVRSEVESRLSSPRASQASPRIIQPPRSSQRRTPNRKTPLRQKNALKQAIYRGSEALKKVQRARRSEELKKHALQNKKAAVREHFTRVSKQGAKNVPILP